MAPDSAYVPGALKHLVVGVRGRWMDPRRTPFHIARLAPQTGHIVIEIDAFEDRGTYIEVPFERFTSFQVEIGSAEASAEDVERFAEIVARFDRPLRLPCASETAARTLQTLQGLQTAASAWLSEHSTFLKQNASLDTGDRRGSHALAVDFRAFMDQQELLGIEDGFATTFVSNPQAESIKGHRIVLAEIGLVPYDGSIVRDPALFEGGWTKERRARHILARLSFLRAFFGHIGRTHMTLYRGMAFDGQLEPPRNHSFVSASFDVEVARSCFSTRDVHRHGLLVRQVVPIERLFMTYFETAQLNRQFLEAEAIVLREPDNPLF